MFKVRNMYSYSEYVGLKCIFANIHTGAARHPTLQVKHS